MFIVHVNDDMTLRMLTARDAVPLYEQISESKDYLKKWLPWFNDIYSVEDALQFIKNSFHTYNNQTAITAGIFMHEELVGIIGFNELDFKNKIGYIGYWLGESYQGKGIMTTAVRALINHAFTEMSLNRIDLRAATENIPSQAIAERLGFKKEGEIRQAEWLYDHFVDHVMYGMVKEDWDNIQ